MQLNTIYNENNLATMARMPDGFIDLTVTSPPYDNLRDYKGFKFPFKHIARHLFRVTKYGGVVVWVVGDATVNGSETGTSFRQALFFQECGFRLHDTMIYTKNGAAYPSHEQSNRYSQVFEYMFVFTKGRPNTYNLLKDRKNRWSGNKTFGKQSNRKADGVLDVKAVRVTEDFGYRYNLWTYNNGFGYSTSDDCAFTHPAIFPEALAADHIKSWSNEGDIVYDPFGGSGTTAKMAHLLNRKWIISEISKEYCELSEKRLKPYLQQMQIFT
jgi:DNA modification methylase